MAVTPNYAWEMPTPGGSSGAWATILNDLFGAIDTDLKAVSDAQAATDIIADAALPLAGGTMTGCLNSHSLREKITALGTTAGATTLDLTLGFVFTATLGGTTTFSFSGNTPGTTDRLTHVRLILLGGWEHVLPSVWPDGVVWQHGLSPALYGEAYMVIDFVTPNGGTNWFGSWLVYYSLLP